MRAEDGGLRTESAVGSKVERSKSTGGMEGERRLERD